MDFEDINAHAGLWYPFEFVCLLQQVAEALHNIGMPTSPPDRLLQDLKAATASVKEKMCARVCESFSEASKPYVRGSPEARKIGMFLVRGGQ